MAIESANIVGYSQNTLQTGLTWVTPQFKGLSNGKLNLQDLQAVGEGTSDTVYIQTLDSYGRTLTSYSWNDWACDAPCWVNDDYEEVTSVEIDVGQGFGVQGLGSTQGIQSAGEVAMQDVVVGLKVGLTFTGNPFPVALDLQDIIPEGDNTSDQVYIQVLDGYGRTQVSYSWNDWACDAPCWVNDDYEEITGVSIVAGQGIAVQGGSSDQSIRFPAPEL